ncbi:methyltransferase domain-containing protein [Sphingomonas sp. AX6]|uniref:methyltransferase domain-containing protein n=1 Tax=Sphingomonas sp. AX6 TaxID=2653171 RepID=UPI0013571513|nr:methyltransferase domain-containing protein [Sphingomonas sp. AX6]
MKFPLKPLIAAAALIALAAPLAIIARTAQATQDDPVVPYVPTPEAVVEGMLDMAKLAPGERLIDLGSGDGRIAIAAAKRGAQAMGVEINPRLVSRARMNAEMAGQKDNARFVRDDLFAVSLREADVVTLYLLPQINEQLRPKLLTEMRPGTRVVSHAFDMGDWPPDEHERIAEKNVYMWTIPAVAGGEWRLVRADGTFAMLDIEQRYSRITGALGSDTLSMARLSGDRLSFTAGGVAYHAIVGDRTITPDPQAPVAAAAGWRAERAE